MMQRSGIVVGDLDGKGMKDIFGPAPPPMEVSRAGKGGARCGVCGTKKKPGMTKCQKCGSRD